MNNLTERIRVLSAEQLRLLKKRLASEGIDFEIDIKEAEKNTFAPIMPVEEKEYYPLSSVQKRLFMLDRFEGTGTTYNVSWVRAIEGELDKKKLEDVFAVLMKRHETLRTSFEIIDGEPIQRVRHYNDIEHKADYLDMKPGRQGQDQDGQTGGKNDMETEIAGKMGSAVRHFIKPFHLGRAPLCRIGVAELSGNRHILVIDMHHIISDLTSKRIISKEFFSLYEGQQLPALKIQYKDFSQWQNSEIVKGAINRQERFWLKQFAGGIPVINLPVDFKRPEVMSYEGGSLQCRISRQETAALKTLALKENTTLFVVMLAVYNVLLSKISRQQDIVVGTTILGRRHAGLNDMIGMFVNTLALRNQPVEENTFKEFLGTVRQRTLDAFENQDYQFEDLVNKVVKTRNMNRNPIFDVFFTLTYPNVGNVQQEDSPDTEPSSFKVKTIDEISMSMFDLYLLCSEVGEEILLAMTYRAKLFKRETIERFIGYLREIVSSIVENNDIKLKDIKVTHDLGTAAANVFEDAEDDFGF